MYVCMSWLGWHVSVVFNYNEENVSFSWKWLFCHSNDSAKKFMIYSQFPDGNEKIQIWKRKIWYENGKLMFFCASLKWSICVSWFITLLSALSWDMYAYLSSYLCVRKKLHCSPSSLPLHLIYTQYIISFVSFLINVYSASFEVSLPLADFFLAFLKFNLHILTQ